MVSTHRNCNRFSCDNISLSHLFICESTIIAKLCETLVIENTEWLPHLGSLSILEHDEAITLLNFIRICIRAHFKRGKEYDKEEMKIPVGLNFFDHALHVHI